MPLLPIHILLFSPGPHILSLIVTMRPNEDASPPLLFVPVPQNLVTQGTEGFAFI